MAERRQFPFWQFIHANRKRKSNGNDQSTVDGGTIGVRGVPSTPRSALSGRIVVRQPVDYSSLLICNYSVKLPPAFAPYPTQRTMIAKILTSLNNKLNALIESPTGSGKTLALLASTCAWLAKYGEERARQRVECRACGGSGREEFGRGEPSSEAPPRSQTPLRGNLPGSLLNTPSATFSFEEELDSDFCSAKTPSSEMKTHSILDSSKKQWQCESGAVENQPEHTCLPRVTVYYGTRTHKQIGQVVKEFSRLPYAHDGTIKHTILASREHSCINMSARGSGDLNGKCKELIAADGVGCPFKASMRGKYEKAAPLRQLISQNSAEPDHVWDIEDLVQSLTSSSPSLCPYFASTRVLTMDADIVFCPFTYLIDPIIRESSEVRLRNAVVVLDEAHNVEDVCRESVSFNFTEKEIVCARAEFCKKVAGLERAHRRQKGKADAEMGLFSEENDERRSEAVEKLERRINEFGTVNRFLSDVLRWFVAVAAEAAKKPVSDDRQACVLTWEKLHTSLDGADLLRFKDLSKGGAFASLREALDSIFGMKAASEENEVQYLRTFTPSDSALSCVEKFVHFFRVYFKEDHRTTYKLFVCIDKPFAAFSRSRPVIDLEAPTDVLDMTVFGRGDQEWVEAKTPLADYKAVKPGYRVTASLWCMLPAVAYQDAFSECRSVILASGTLCPVDTFQTELGTQFKQQMEGSQVIPKEQIFATVVPSGPTGYRLCGTYRNINSDDRFLREVSHVVRQVCESVPRGILCFVTSYRFLDQFYDFMETCGVLRQIQSFKHVVREPRRSSQLTAMMDDYERAVLEPALFGSQCTGALMMAVFRGKCSEGIDFADDRARCVISIGIPFPNVRDELVLEKKRFNDDNSSKLRILSGDEWYTMQAYRALNQALGRCLRHRNDWGVILMVDDRLLQNRSNPNASKVSKWIREQLRVPASYNDFLAKLSGFLSEMQKPAEASSSAIVSSDSHS